MIPNLIFSAGLTWLCTRSRCLTASRGRRLTRSVTSSTSPSTSSSPPSTTRSWPRLILNIFRLHSNIFRKHSNIFHAGPWDLPQHAGHPEHLDPGVAVWLLLASLPPQVQVVQLSFRATVSWLSNTCSGLGARCTALVLKEDVYFGSLRKDCVVMVPTRWGTSLVEQAYGNWWLIFYPPVQVQQQVRGAISFSEESQLLPWQLPRGRLAHRQ